MLIVFPGYSQNTSTTDTLRCVPVKQLINAMQAKDSLKIMTQENKALRNYIDSADAVINKSNRVIDKMDSINIKTDSLSIITEKIRLNQANQTAVYKRDNDVLKKTIKNQGALLKVGAVVLVILNVISFFL